MYKPEKRQRSFYDALYENGAPEGHSLRRLDGLIRWDRLEKRLRRFYRELEEAARDRLSFRWFCRIDPVGSPPDWNSNSGRRIRS